MTASLLVGLGLALGGCQSAGEPTSQTKSGEATNPAQPDTSSSPSTFDITGLVEVEAISNGKPGAPCRPDEASDQWPARPGSQKSGVEVGGDVTVTDSSGQVVGLGEFLVGEYVESGYRVSSYCTVPFKVEDVRGEDEFYGLAVGDLPIEQYTREELSQPIAIVVPGS